MFLEVVGMRAKGIVKVMSCLEDVIKHIREQD